MQTEDMARDVRVAIDMNREDAPLILEGDRETLSIDDIIKAKLGDGIRMVEIEAPRHMLESGHDFGERMFIGADGKGFVILPEDFMRLISFRMSDWRRTVYEAISDDDPAYGLQSSRWKGVCGTPYKPVCAIVRRNEGKVLEFYSSREDKPGCSCAGHVSAASADRRRRWYRRCRGMLQGSCLQGGVTDAGEPG